jgi:uncharacterized protein YdhG (YjbR/CyaY superfamily)
MKKELPAYNNIDEYIALFPKEVQKHLKQVKETIQKTAPKAEEAITYGIPTFKLHGNLVHFAGYQYHVGFYPGASGIREFQKDFSNYKTSKGTVQFPNDQPMPLKLIAKIVKFRVAENLAKAEKKRKSKGAH